MHDGGKTEKQKRIQISQDEKAVACVEDTDEDVSRHSPGVGEL